EYEVLDFVALELGPYYSLIDHLSIYWSVLCIFSAVTKEEPASLIFDDKPIEKTPLGDAIDSLMVRWAQLLSNVSSRAPVPAPSTIDHVKEVVEISMYHVGNFVSKISRLSLFIILESMTDEREPKNLSGDS
uniref:Protein kinase domain-containing protein n=1 Tax=Angiostrongylus cantonensis TaxID=6313 RepID=A0A0K0DDH3_ANGCA